MTIHQSLSKEAIGALREGGVGIIPTDTIYGIVASTQSKSAVEKIYRLKKRGGDKPCIILVPNIKAIERFGAVGIRQAKKLLKRPRTSVILPIRGDAVDELRYLHRGTKTLAFRVPRNKFLQKFLVQTGPLVAPSANPEDLPPAQTAEEAQEYFGESVDFYVEGGRLKRTASKIYRFTPDSTFEKLR